MTTNRIIGWKPGTVPLQSKFGMLPPHNGSRNDDLWFSITLIDDLMDTFEWRYGLGYQLLCRIRLRLMDEWMYGDHLTIT